MILYPPVHLSVPSVVLPATIVDNEATLARVRAHFTGDDDEWRRIKRSIDFVFRTCGTRVRHLEEEAPRPVAAHPARAATALLERYGVAAGDLDVIVYASISRDYFEPATASEIAARLGADQALAFDVLAACAGPVVALEEVAARMAIDPAVRTAMICTASISGPHLTWEIPTAASLDTLAAGLTIGNAATAFLVTRAPPAGPHGRLVGGLSESRSRFHDLCRVPTHGHFYSAGSAMFALAAEVPPHVRRSLARVGWTPEGVDTFVFHQPSDRILRDIAAAMGVPGERMPGLHHVYANTESSAVPLTLRHLHDQGRIQAGQRLLLGSAAAGFVISSMAVEWLA